MNLASVPDYKQRFVEFMLEAGVLTFGDFTTKSGRRTPYFINTGNYDNGRLIRRLGQFYARELMERTGGEFDNLYGPAYKGIPLAVTTVAALDEMYGKTVTFTFNRKEQKDHGEGGGLVGHRYRDGDRVVIIEDVITAGTSIRESIPLLRAAAAVELKGIVISVDRREKGQGDCSAVEECRRQFEIPVHPIVTIDEIIGHLSTTEVNGRRVITDELADQIRDYRSLYGA